MSLVFLLPFVVCDLGLVFGLERFRLVLELHLGRDRRPSRPPCPPLVGDRIAGVDLEARSAVFQPQRVHRPLSDVVPDVGTRIVFARAARLAVGEHVREPDGSPQVLYQLTPGGDLRGRRPVLAVGLSLPPLPSGAREVAGELDGNAPVVEAVRRPEERRHRVQLQDPAVLGDRKVRVDAQEALQRIFRLEAARHLVEDQRVHRFRIPRALPMALVSLRRQVDHVRRVERAPGPVEDSADAAADSARDVAEEFLVARSASLGARRARVHRGRIRRRARIGFSRGGVCRWRAHTRRGFRALWLGERQPAADWPGDSRPAAAWRRIERPRTLRGPGLRTRSGPSSRRTPAR